MNEILFLTKRNVKLFFKDKGMFFTALITPAILLVLYATFLGNVYKDSFTMHLPEGVTLPSSLINGLVGGQLISSLLAVSCVTVAFCSNFLMVQDKANGSLHDLKITPVKASALSISYYCAALFSTLTICYFATALSLVYVAIVGWYMSVGEVVLLFLDVTLLTLFGKALSSVINFFLSTQGQISAVGSIVSSGYGFICGAYMPISSFGNGLQKVVSFLPGTYGTSLMRNHALGGVFAEMESQGVPMAVIESMKGAVDCNLYFFGNQVPIWVMYAVLCATVAVLAAAYILMNALKKKDK
jgi:multidrug/hemolysin transport system permease protein